MSDLDYKPVTHDHESFLKKVLKRKEFREAYEGLAEEYALAREMLVARSKSGLTQEAVAELMGMYEKRSFPPGSGRKTCSFS